jgi:hypothetical protein
LLRIFKKIKFPLGMQVPFRGALYPVYFHYASWFDTKILFILQDSLIRVSRRDEERRILKELASVIVEHVCSSE